MSTRAGEMMSNRFVLRQIDSFTDLGFAKIGDPKEITAGEQCTPGENGFNAQIANYFRNLIGLVAVIEQEVAKLENGSRQMAGLASAMERHDANIHGVVGWSGCEPSGTFVAELAKEHSAAVAAVGARSNLILGRLFANFTAAVDGLEQAAQELAALRGNFDTSETPPATVEVQFQTLTRLFTIQDAECNTYGLVKVGIRNGGWDPTAQLTRAAAARAIASSVSTLSDLDRLRFEYAESGLRCPLPGRFSRGKSSKYFSQGELNHGDSPWALLPDETLSVLDGLHEKVAAVLGRNLTIKDLYLNPRRIRATGGDPQSEHQYGRAVDLQVTDFNGDGTVDASDWNLLKALVDEAGPTRVDDIEVSGTGQVRAEWTQVSSLANELVGA